MSIRDETANLTFKEADMTNGDRIRSMSDEQLVDFLSRMELGDIDYAVTFCDLCKDGGNALGLDCDGCLLHWLKMVYKDS